MKNVNFDLFSNEYYSTVDFYLNGIARIHGVMWTRYCGMINEEYSTSQIRDENISTDYYLQFIENAILTTAYLDNIQNILETSEENASMIQQLVIKYQINHNLPIPAIPMPSLETMFRLEPSIEVKPNLVASKMFISFLKSKLILLTEEEREQISTQRWLDNFSKEAHFRIVGDSSIEIKIESLRLTFILEERLNTLITRYGLFSGTYHYSLSCSSKQYSIILKRNRILDCFVLPFNTYLLKAFRSKIHLLPVHSEFAWWEFEENFEKKLPEFDNPDIMETLKTHSIVSVPELYALSDTHKVFDILSSPSIFISTYQNQNPKFRKERVRSDDSYECPGKGFYKKLSSNTLRHFGRLNGKSLLLVETAIYYDLVPEIEGLKLFEIYERNLDKIDDSDLIAASGDIMPKLILCENKQVMKIRKKERIMQTPSFPTLSVEDKYAQILLYYPLRPKAEIDTTRLGKSFHLFMLLLTIIHVSDDYYYQIDNNQVVDKNGRILTIIEKNQRYVHIMLLYLYKC